MVQQYLQRDLWHPVCWDLPCGFSVMLLFWAVNVVHSLQFKELKIFHLGVCILTVVCVKTAGKFSFLIEVTLVCSCMLERCRKC